MYICSVLPVLHVTRAKVELLYMYNSTIRFIIQLLGCIEEKTAKGTKVSSAEMPRLNQNQRMQAIGMVDAGLRHYDVANRFGVTRATITRLVTRYRTRGSAADVPRSGRPRVTTPEQDRHIRTSHLRDRFLPATRTAVATPGRTNNRISAQTVRNRLAERGIRAFRPYTGAMLTRRHRQLRREWTGQHARWIQVQWNSVLFTDESRFCLRRGDGRERVYRRRGERFADACVRQVDRFGGGSVMVWGGITFNNRTDLVFVDGNLTAQRYCDEILAPVVVPFFDVNRRVTLLQQDNARCHSARLTTEFLQQANIEVLPWPALSPDLSPIEHLWDALDRRVRIRQPATLRQLHDILREEWTNIPQADIQALIRSMRRRCVAVRDANGGHTRY